MSLLLDLVLNHGMLMDAIGILGLGLLCLAAVKLARRNQSWGGNMLAIGAIALLVARVYLVLSPHFVNDELLHAIGPIGISLTFGVPQVLLTLGLGSIVWGLWCHERWLAEADR